MHFEYFRQITQANYLQAPGGGGRLDHLRPLGKEATRPGRCQPPKQACRAKMYSSPGPDRVVEAS
jgi:hypothetical protein